MKKDDILKIASSLEALAANPDNILSIEETYSKMDKEAEANVDTNELDEFMNIILDSLENF